MAKFRAPASDPCKMVHFEATVRLKVKHTLCYMHAFSAKEKHFQYTYPEF